MEGRANQHAVRRPRCRCAATTRRTLAAAAELRAGGWPYRDVLHVSGEVGIGAGIVVDGELFLDVVASRLGAGAAVRAGAVPGLQGVLADPGGVRVRVQEPAGI